MNTVRCPQCNLANWETAANCKRCGRFLPHPDSVSEKAPPATNSPAFQAPPARPTRNWTPPNDNRQNNRQYDYHPKYQAAKQKTGLAIASMVLGIIGFVGCFFTAPVGLTLGIISLVKSNRRPFEYGGNGFAIAGIVLNGFGVLALPLVAAIAIPNLLAARRAANEGSAIYTVREIAQAEGTYRETTAGRCGDIQTLIATRLLDVDLAKEEKSGYRFQVINLPNVEGGCEIHATPLTTSQGTRSFYYSTEDELIRAADKKGRPADKDALPLDTGGSPRNSRPPKIASQESNSY